jgi:hypothetical protein
VFDEDRTVEVGGPTRADVADCVFVAALEWVAPQVEKLREA